jgi:aminocarboxymuconate-semialdehyde decarboxylase
MICDVHAHCLPSEVNQILVEKHGVQALRRGNLVPLDAPLDESDGDVDARVAMMDDAGVEVQVLSLVPLPLVGDEADLVHRVRSTNDAMASMAARHPARFKVHAELPLPYLDASLKELDRCRTELGFDSVNILASHGTASAVAEEFDPLFEELNRTRTIVFFHPRISGLCSPLITDFGLTSVLGPALEDTVLVFQMIARQFPLRFSNLDIVIPHLGGMLPIYMDRMDNQLGRALPDLPERPSDTARRLWYDTLVHGSGVALRSACESFGVDRLLTGSDYPAMQFFGGYKPSFDYIRHSGLADREVEQILHVNAPKLFSLS